MVPPSVENSILTLNLPYKVKIIETKKEEKNNKKPMINFSIIIITENDEEKLKNGELDDAIINEAEEWGDLG